MTSFKISERAAFEGSETATLKQEVVKSNSVSNPFSLRNKDVEHHQLKNRHSNDKGKKTAGKCNKIRDQGDVELKVSKSEKQSPSTLVERGIKSIEKSGALEKSSEGLQSKRELFLLQFSINLIKDEIRKLEHSVLDKKESIAHIEQLLAIDTAKMNRFLKESDERTQDAIRNVHKGTQLRLEKMKKVRKLNLEVLECQEGLKKHEGILEESSAYSNFLDIMTPMEWVKDRRHDKKERQEKRRRERISRRREEWKVENAKAICEIQAKVEEDLKKVAKPRRHRGKQEKTVEDYLAELERMKKLEPPICDDEPITSSDDELPMYFTKPHQIVDVLAALEKENVSLIQTTQEVDQAAEELRLTYTETSASMESKVQYLYFKIQTIKEKVAKVEAKADSAHRLEMISYESESNRALEQLRKNVKQVYSKCGFSDGDSNISTLSMLVEIESYQEQILEKLAAIPDEYVKKSEREREKKRREWKRLQNQERQRRAQEEKNKKYLERSLQPPTKIIGPPVSTCIKYYI
jgi:hypothetical protein